MAGHSVTPRSLTQRLIEHAEKTPHRDAIVTPDFLLSYYQLYRLVLAQTQALIEAGITNESVIGIECTDDVQHLLLCLAAVQLGVTSCTIPSFEDDAIKQAIINRCKITQVVTQDSAINPQQRDTADRPEADIAPVIDAQLLFSTSGTTGEPKLVIHDDIGLVAQAHRHINSNQERFACLASMEHNFAKRHRLYCIAEGATNIFFNTHLASQTKPTTLVDQCLALQANVLHVSAFQAQELLAMQDVHKLAHIRLKLGGSHVPSSLRQQLKTNITKKLQAGYGTTETGAIGFTAPDDDDSGESVGQPLPGIEICAASQHREPLPTGERGELAIRCDGMFRGYLNQPELTSARLASGWFYTGDIGYLDEQGRIHLCGRSDDMFVFNSLNIYPQDIESQLCQHPDIAEAVVLPKPSPVHGNIPVALIVLKDPTKPRLPAIRKYARKQLGLRCPRQFTVVKTLPRNSSGKVARKEVTNIPVEGHQIRRAVIQVLQNAEAIGHIKASIISGFEQGERDIALDDIDINSLTRMDLLVMLETNYDIVISPLEFSKYQSLGDIATHVLLPPAQPYQTTCTRLKDIITASSPTQTDSKPYIVAFFQRTLRYCRTASQLHQALFTLAHRLTPTEIELLLAWHLADQLVAPDTAHKFHVALNQWFQNIKAMMYGSGKNEPEPFIFRRIAPSIIHFAGPGRPADKTLIICFATKGGRRLMMPNAVLMQHTDARSYDLMIISEPRNEGYLAGIPMLGDNVYQVAEWIAKQELIAPYKHIRTLGCSAGAYMALIAAYRLNAELALCVGGRFHSERYPGKILSKIFTTIGAVRKGHCSRVLMSYASDNSRDRRYAKVIGKICDADQIDVKFTQGKIGHYILEHLVEARQLAPFLKRTLFVDINGNDQSITTPKARVTFTIPSPDPQGADIK